MEEKQSYIYSLEYPEGNVKYIGKANDLKKRLKGHLDKINQHVSHKNSWIKGLLSKGVKPIINVVDVIPEKEWQFWEEHYIWLYRSYGFKLTNLTFGGDGMSNPSPETIEKIRKSVLKCYANGFEVWNKGTKGMVGSWNKGIVRTEEQKKKISETKKAQYASGERVTWNKGIKTGHTPWNKGKKGVMPEPWNKGKSGLVEAWNKGVPMSEESKRKCSLNSTHSKAVKQFTLDGEFIKDWRTAKEAQEYVKCAGVNICCNGKTSSVAGFLWFWSGDYTEEKLKHKVYEYKNKNKNKSRGLGGSNPSAKKVKQIDPETNEVVKIFDCVKDAIKETGRGGIASACRGKRLYAGFKWEYKNTK